MSDLVGNTEDRFSGVMAHLTGATCFDLSRLVGKPTICIGENKDADQVRGNR